jgi:hypothetical protein
MTFPDRRSAAPVFLSTSFLLGTCAHAAQPGTSERSPYPVEMNERGSEQVNE